MERRGEELCVISHHRGEDHFYTRLVYIYDEEISHHQISSPGKIIYDPVPEWTSVIGPKILWQLPSFKTVDGFADRNSSFHFPRVFLRACGAVFSVPLCLSQQYRRKDGRSVAFLRRGEGRGGWIRMPDLSNQADTFLFLSFLRRSCCHLRI